MNFQFVSLLFTNFVFSLKKNVKKSRTFSRYRFVKKKNLIELMYEIKVISNISLTRFRSKTS
ncbi:hypothetical protein LEP1GSC169_1985 [Leptospira santarosai str. HAI1349]|nr:hypothetical protein LEP1GSC169_1985 [Leptospira santarosai str. HAI1349]